MRPNDPLFTSHEDSFGYGCERNQSSRYRPKQGASSLNDPKCGPKNVAVAGGPKHVHQAGQKTHTGFHQPRVDRNIMTRRSYDVSPPSCAAEEPRLVLRNYDYRDVSPVRSETPDYLRRLYAKGFGKGRLADGERQPQRHASGQDHLCTNSTTYGSRLSKVGGQGGLQKDETRGRKRLPM
jgi:hypothetical protein